MTGSDGITRGVPKKDRIGKDGLPAPDRWAIAYDALVTFLDDPAKHNYEILRKVALALAKMIAPKPAPEALSTAVATAAIELGYNNDLPPELDWSGRKHQCCETSRIMDDLIKAASVRKINSARSRP